MGIEENPPQVPAPHPDTVKPIQDVIGPVIDNLVAKSEGGNEDVQAEAVRRARRRVDTRHTDVAHEIAGIEGERVALEDEFQVNPDPHVREAWEDTQRNYKAAKADQDELPSPQE